MSVIYINRAHQFPIDDLKLKIDGMKKDIEERFEVRSEWESDHYLRFRRKGLSGSIEIDDLNFQFKLNLSMMYRMVRTEIENEVVSIVNKNF